MAENETNVEKVDNFLSEAGVWYFLTTDDGKPKGRPFGFHQLKDGTIYFGTGTFKNVYHQLVANPQVEVLACKGGQFMRYDGTVVLDDDEAGRALGQAAVDASPVMGKIYNDETGKRLGIFHLENAHVEFLNGRGDVADEFEL